MKAAIISSNAPEPYAEVADVDIPEITDDRMLVKTVAVAANPTDWKHVDFGSKSGIMGSDASGIVERVGKNVKGFAEGDIVGVFDHGNVDFVRGKFAEYVSAHPDACIKVEKSNFNPDEVLVPGTYASSNIVNFESLASVNLGLVTVSVVFNHSLKVPQDKKGNQEKYILIWGGATASGVLAIQVAKLIYGLKVITTCSTRNAEFLKSLGADEVYDYKQPDVVDTIRKAANGKISFALDTTAYPETHQATYDCLLGSGNVRFESLLGLNENEITPNPDIKVEFVRSIAYTALDEDVQMLRGYEATPELLADHRDFWYNLLPPVISQLKTAHLWVLKPGLESVNESIDLLKSNKVSAQKVVFRV